MLIVRCTVFVWTVLAAGFVPSWALEHVTFRDHGRSRRVSGQVLVEAQDGGLLLLARDGAIWEVQPDQLQGRQSDDVPFRPLSNSEIAQQLLQELPAGFRIHQTAHYVIGYNTSEAYAQWCGGLYERLYRGFYSYWKNRGLTLKPLRFPLIALVFDNQKSYAEVARKEIGDAATSIIGYYNMQTNRVMMYDLTGVDAVRKHQRRIKSAAHINEILSQPTAERTVATIVHEATHQLAYNSGLQTRYADNPFWVSEGIAVYFETPDLRSSKGWRNIGSVNRVHLAKFRKIQDDLSVKALLTLLQDDDRFRNPQTAPDAYAQAWSLNYYLLRARRREYLAYLKELGTLRPSQPQSAEQRVARFRRFFGDDLDRFNRDFLRYMRKVR